MPLSVAPGHSLQHPLCPLRKVVRRASLSDRTNLYRKEYEGEAILWQQRSATEDQRTSTYNGDIRETRTDQENKDPVSDLPPCPVSAMAWENRARPGFSSLGEPSEGDSWPISSWLPSGCGGFCS